MALREHSQDMFRPPLARGMRTLDRSIFQKTIPLKAARVFENKNIAKIRSQLERSRDALHQDRLANVYSDPDPERARAGKKCVILRPEVKVDLNGAPYATNGYSNGISAASTPWPHSTVLTELVNLHLIDVIPYNLALTYDYWTYHDIVASILPLEALVEIPSGFSQVGHIAHLNLRSDYLPYKSLIAEILLDKNPTVRTVINKIDDVGSENEFRTFNYEVLAGPNDLNVTVSEAECTFKFDYSKVYWNPRLSTEHERLVSMFKPGEAVCDVCAGVGPFAIPAGKKGCFVWANDLNPASTASLAEAIGRNKVEGFVRPFKADGRVFTKEAAEMLLLDEHGFEVQIKKKRSRKDENGGEEVVKTAKMPKTFQHFVLNLPASALTFLPSFVGLYTPKMRERLTEGTKMPVVHVYCFGGKDELINGENGRGDEQERQAASGAAAGICEEISRHLGHKMRPGKIEEDGGVEVYDVRDVAPKKRMFCASFRLPEEVAFRTT